MMKYLLVFLALCSLASAREDVPFFGETDVIGHRFVLDSLNGEKFSSESEVFIEFPERGKIAGRICNTFRGPCRIERYILTAEVASTRMRCPDDKLGDFENKFFTFMKYGINFVRFGDTLEFRRDDVSAVFRLADRKDAKDEKAAPAQPQSAAQTSIAGVTAQDLEGRKFVLEKADGKEFAAATGKQPFIQFSEGMKVNGSACNGFMGPGALEDGKLFLRNAASTMMMCVDEALSGYERDFHQMLRNGAAISLEGDALTLSGNGKSYQYREEK